MQPDRLARRIAWLYRFRRPLALILTAIVATLSISAVRHALPDNWPSAHLVAIAAMLAFFSWYGVELFLGFLLALWETDHNTLTRPGFPAAYLTRRSARRIGMSVRRRA